MRSPTLTIIPFPRSIQHRYEQITVVLGATIRPRDKGRTRHELWTHAILAHQLVKNIKNKIKIN
jgi:hypothetical protein